MSLVGFLVKEGKFSQMREVVNGMKGFKLRFPAALAELRKNACLCSHNCMDSITLYIADLNLKPPRKQMTSHYGVWTQIKYNFARSGIQTALANIVLMNAVFASQLNIWLSLLQHIDSCNNSWSWKRIIRAVFVSHSLAKLYMP